MHKATISVDSHLGEGSCFKVDFLKGKEHYDKEAEFILEDADAPARMGQVVDIANSSIQSETLVSPMNRRKLKLFMRKMLRKKRTPKN